MKLTLKRIGITAIVLTFLFYSCNNSSRNQVTDRLPRSTPETEGVDSKGIIDFLNAAEKSNHEFHSFMLLRHGKVVAEGWWSPYSPPLKHTLIFTKQELYLNCSWICCIGEEIENNGQGRFILPGGTSGYD
jgi:hypothetical protein